MAWDIRNRLTQVINGSKTINYKYDHNDLRMEKDIVVGTIHELSRYYYDGSLLLAEKDIDGKLQKTYINDGEGIVGFIRYIYDDSGTFSHYQRLYYLYDSLGSVSYITGENGLPLQNYTYSPYGSTLNVERDPLNGLRFVGRYGGYADDDSGLVYFWHRWYDERDGRWVSRDPVNIKGGINLYNYTENIPIKFIDENGLTCRNYWDAYSECQNSYSKCMNTLMAVGSVMTGVMGGFTCFITIHVPACPPLGAVAAAAVKVSCEIPHTIDKAAEQYCGYARNLCLQQADIDFPRR